MFKPAVTQMSRSEKTALILNHTEPENFERMRNILQIASEEQLDQFVRTAQALASKNVSELELKTTQARLLLAQNGLMQSEQNWLILQSHLGDHYSFEQARNLILSNATVRAGLVWRGTPFTEYDRQMAEQQAAEAREQAEELRQHEAVEQEKEAGYRLFATAAKQATIRGISVSPNRANFSLVLDVLYAKSKPLTMENILWAIFQGNLNFAQDDTAQVHQQERKNIYASIRPRLTGDPHSEQIRILCNTLPIVELRERIKLADILSQISRDRSACDQAFRGFMVSRSPNSELKQNADIVLENRRLRSLNPTELRAEAALARGQQPQQVGGYPPLPDNIMGDDIMRMDANQIRDLIKRHGRHALDLRIAEYREAVQAMKENRSPRF